MSSSSLPILLLLAIGLSTLVLGHCSADETDSALRGVEVDGLHNVLRITDQLYSGNGPDGDRSFASLKKLGIKTIISVDGATPDVERARKAGLRYVHIPIGYNGVPRAKALQIAKAIQELPAPFYIHCHHGKHRGPTAAAVALLCADEQCKVEDALAVMNSAGTDQRYAGLFKSAKSFERPTREELAKLTGELPEAVQAAGITQGMVVLDHSFDNLKLVRAAGWKTPADHPDIDPAHEALQLVEGYQELRRLPELAKRPSEFRKWLDDGHASARELEHLLRTSKDKAIATEAAEKTYRRAAAVCTQCHAKYRDVP